MHTPQTSVESPALDWRDYYEMCKPKVVALMLLTSVIGMLLASESWVGWSVFLWANLGIALVASSGAAINHIVDRHIDAKMARTNNRPLAKGRVPVVNGVVFAAVIGVVGMLILMLLVNAITAWLTLAAFVGYGFIYTGFLKRATPQNIVIGGIAGAAPPLLGWTAVTNQIDADGLLLVLIIFAWTPPHFWALAIHRKDDYAKAGIPMLPVTHGERYTKVHILLYTLILFAVSLMPFVTGMSGLIYLVSAAILGVGFLVWSLILLNDWHPKAAMETFKYSIIYLMLLFIALLVDHYVG